VQVQAQKRRSGMPWCSKRTIDSVLQLAPAFLLLLLLLLPEMVDLSRVMSATAPKALGSQDAG